jgi:hypothetical protein
MEFSEYTEIRLCKHVNKLGNKLVNVERRMVVRTWRRRVVDSVPEKLVRDVRHSRQAG